MNTSLQIAILDDYQNVAFSFGDWSTILKKAQVVTFNDHITDQDAIIQRLMPFHVICVMRERTPLTRAILSGLPNLKLIISTGQRNASIDTQAAEESGISISMTGYHGSGAPELTWALLLAISRHIVAESASLREGNWQKGIGVDLKGKTIGIIGLGNIGSVIARYAKAFEMEVVAWSENLTLEKAHEHGVKLVGKEELFKTADFVTVHLILSARSRNIITSKELSLMKPSAYFINTSRGPLVNEADLINTLQNKKIAGAALDVYDIEPLPTNHPFRNLPNLLATPHIGYVTKDTYQIFFEDTIQRIEEFLATRNAE
ncbi:MAG: D-2-hydroxyacid dehydrogenase family protein [Candidatus Pedobacter colombiensis]|uniref:D-2-hydroxyacid dehydrogenase family protein n=1 Tax=Candidatus Pedobacter colombiensis TaxID=3121371 RepID=A0AAJ5W4D7_9SPHI|nr:D-2-hydroxyacid dehydrogenase family protein [Pedobacter sp.]WEK17752.1 MAG: D-2-hydroxyacid dehydrogenase family protein [Pedobacter sp.]